MQVIGVSEPEQLSSWAAPSSGENARAASAMRPTRVRVDATCGLIHRHVDAKRIGRQSF
jgi:hypothetical protein